MLAYIFHHHIDSHKILVSIIKHGFLTLQHTMHLDKLAHVIVIIISAEKTIQLKNN